MELPVSAISDFPEIWRQKNFNEFNNSQLTSAGSCLVSNATEYFSYFHFDSLPSGNRKRGSGAFTFPSREWKPLYEDTLKHLPAGKKLILSFWIFQYQQDACLRANLEIFQKNSRTGELTNYVYTDFFRCLKALDDDWALIEIEVETMSDAEYIKASVRNTALPGRFYTIDELLIRENSQDVWEQEGKYFFLNTRRFVVR
jgi:hypothetical protein